MLSAVQSGAENGVNGEGQLEESRRAPGTFQAATHGPARVYAEPNRSENDEGKTSFCEIGLQFRPCDMQAENYPKYEVVQ